MKIHDPAMTFAEGKEADWLKGLNNNQDGYGLACFRFASEWATRMEKIISIAMEMTKESPHDSSHVTVAGIIDKAAKDASHAADDEGITGYMYGVAVSMLSDCWIHGEELRKWHNLDTQIGTEGEDANESGGTLNPALLCVGKK